MRTVTFNVNHTASAVRNYLWLVIALIIWSVPAIAQEQNPTRGRVVEPTLPPPVEVWDVLRSNLSIIDKVKDLPETVRAELAKALHTHTLEMGDREHDLPRHYPDAVVTRLIFAGVSSEGCFVYYSAIGFAGFSHIIVFDSTGHPLWAAKRRLDSHDGTNLEELRSLIAEGQFYPYALQRSPRR